MKKIAKIGTVKGLKEVPKNVQNVFVTAHDVLPEWHVKMQAAFQRHTDNAVSKTVNLSHDATADDVKEVFTLAYKSQCKGVTIYRDGSRDMQVLNIGKVQGKEKESGENALCDSCAVNNMPGKVEPRPRPDITTGFTEKVGIGCGNLYITVNYDENGICEVFTNTGRAGGCPSQSEATSRLVSVALRSGMDVKSIVEQLKGKDLGQELLISRSMLRSGESVLLDDYTVGQIETELGVKIRIVDNDGASFVHSVIGR
jgi:ribonucleoside-diphosphate reductase alpha chain